MSTITKNFANHILVQGDNMTQPAIFTNSADAVCTYTENSVRLSFGNKGYVFSSDWGISTFGPLTEVLTVDVSAWDPVDIAALINTNVLTEDRASGDPVIIADTTMVEGQFTVIEAITDSVLDVSDSAATVEVDGSGDPIATLADYAGQTIPKGAFIYGKFTQIQLISGAVKAYSNLSNV